MVAYDNYSYLYIGGGGAGPSGPAGRAAPSQAVAAGAGESLERATWLRQMYIVQLWEEQHRHGVTMTGFYECSVDWSKGMLEYGEQILFFRHC